MRSRRILALMVTLFYGGQRVLTSVRDQDGQRAVGTLAAPEVIQQVLAEEQAYFSDRVEVNGVLYFGYYMPIANSDGSVVGMMFAGRPRAEVLGVICKNIIGIILIALTVMVVTIGFTLFFGKRLIRTLNGIKEFLRKVAGGDLQAEMEEEWTASQDELGEMARFALMLRDSLIELVGTDPLTGLYNRRSSAVGPGQISRRPTTTAVRASCWPWAISTGSKRSTTATATRQAIMSWRN